MAKPLAVLVSLLVAVGCAHAPPAATPAPIALPEMPPQLEMLTCETLTVRYLDSNQRELHCEGKIRINRMPNTCTELVMTTKADGASVQVQASQFKTSGPNEVVFTRARARFPEPVESPRCMAVAAAK